MSARSLPPLVPPGAELSVAEVARYSRHLIIPDVGMMGQRRLKNARVLVIGAGGLGSPVLLYLAAAGVGTLGLVDFDVVDSSNLQRQVIHTEARIGMPKAESARAAITELNSFVSVRLHTEQLTRDNALALFAGYDLIIDGTDNFATRYLVNDAAELTGKPYVWGSIYRFAGQVSVFWAAAPDGRGITYRDLYPDPPAPGTVPSCAEGGVLGVLCGTVGAAMATEAIKLITGIGEPLLGRVLLYDALAATYRTVRVRRDPARTPVTALVDYEQFCGLAPVPGAADGDAVVGNTDEVTPVELRELIERGEVAVIDVREPVEWDIVRIPGANLVRKDDIVSGRALGDLPQDRPLVLYCKTGIRSAEALAAVQQAGFTRARHLSTGILGWIRDVDPGLPAY